VNPIRLFLRRSLSFGSEEGNQTGRGNRYAVREKNPAWGRARSRVRLDFIVRLLWRVR